ncbi:MAG: HAD family phosphatase [Bacteroidaceae bacterium]|nr:HAD family phosphatase [Bacteroidaceae bacterium]
MAIDKKNIVFDLGGILLDIHPQRTFEAFAALGADRAVLSEAYTLANSTMMGYEKGLISTEELYEFITALLPQQTREMPADALQAHIRDAWRALIGDLPLYKWQRLTGLRRRGHKLFLLSNTNALHWEQIARNIEQIEGKRVEEYFDRIFLSYEMRRCKPDKEIFVQMLQEAGMQACDTLFFDDSADNCAAARSVGIDAVLVERNSQWGDILLKD